MAQHLADGATAERLARRYLERRGLALVAANYRCPMGELDLLMDEGETLVVVEIRYRRRPTPADPAETVLAPKRRRILRSTLHFLARHPERAARPVRFDIVSLSGPLENATLRWIPGAFDAEELANR